VCGTILSSSGQPFDFLSRQFPYFRSAPAGWKVRENRDGARSGDTDSPLQNSVRHNLSLNPCFEKVPRPLTDRGKGSYWTVNDNVDPRTGVHRVRKKRTKAGSAAAAGGDFRGSDREFDGGFDGDLDAEGARGGDYTQYEYVHRGNQQWIWS
jgi:hypothetical protein